MTTRPTLLDTAPEAALTEVLSTTEALRQARRARAPLSELRAAFSAAADALDAALDAARTTGSVGRPLVHQLQTARDRLILQRRDTEGMNLPDCAQTTSLDAEGPHIPGIDFERVDPHGPAAAHMHGLDLTAALEPASRETAGRQGAHPAPRRYTPPRWLEEPWSKAAGVVLDDGTGRATGHPFSATAT